MLLLADQPLVDAAYLRRMVDTWMRDPERIVASEYAGVTGPPVIFPARCYDDLIELDGDSGARQVIRSNAAFLTTLDCANAAVDIDRKEDLDELD
jgi:molybdenum cofactor cytidylyltransferase